MLRILSKQKRTMQEGELRPQLLDRFGMSVNVTTLLDVDVRTQMVLDKMAYEEVSHLICLGMCLMLHGTCLHTWKQPLYGVIALPSAFVAICAWKYASMQTMQRFKIMCNDDIQ